MALTKASVLHYWSARYGINPRIGGRPVFTRNSAGLYTTQEGEINSAIVNTPRFDWATLNLPNSLTERRKVLTLELASTNIITSELSAWTLTGATRTASQSDPRGASNAYLINATAGGGTASAVPPFTGNSTKGVSLRVRQGNSTVPEFGIYSNTAVAWRGRVLITWSAAGVPALTVAAGALSYMQATQLGGGWWDIRIGVQNVVAADTNVFYLYPGGVGGTGTTYVYRPQAEDGVFATAMIDGVSTTRAIDSCYWNFPPVPQAMVIYERLVTGDVLEAAAHVRWRIAGIDESTPYLQVYTDATAHILTHHNGTSPVSSSIAASHTVGETHELLGIVTAASVQLVKSVNGAAVVSGAATGALAFGSAWAGTRLWMNSLAALYPGGTGNAELKIVKYADVVALTGQGIMDELRAFELGPNADVL